MKASKEQLKDQEQQFGNFIEDAKYELKLEDGKLLHQLQINLTVFDLVMNRTVCDGFDPLYEDERKAVHDFWFELSGNLKTALELLDMADSTARGFSYDSERKGSFISYTSLKDKLNGSPE